MSAAPGTVAAVFVALYSAHQVADHWVQTQHQADHKGCDQDHGSDRHAHCTVWRSRWNCAKHVITYGATQLVALAAVAAVTGWRPAALSLAAGMAVNLVTHYIADRRALLRWIAERSGAASFYQLGAPRPGRDDNPSLGTGAYALDQSWHIGWLFITALIVAA